MKKLTLLSLIAAMSFMVIGCGDDAPPPSDGPVESTEMSIRCYIKPLTDMPIPASLDVAFSGPLEDGATVDATIDVGSTLDEMLAMTILSLGMGDSVTLSSMTATVDLTGTDVAAVDLENTATPLTIDFGDPGPPPVPEVNVLATDTAVETVVVDSGATEVTAALSSLVVSLTDVPLLMNLAITVPAPNVRCTEDGSACAQGEICWGATDATSTMGWCGADDGGMAIEVFCELPTDGTNEVTFAVPTPAP